MVVARLCELSSAFHLCFFVVESCAGQTVMRECCHRIWVGRDWDSRFARILGDRWHRSLPFLFFAIVGKLPIFSAQDNSH